MSDISGILEDLAAGRIDPSVAAERIAAAQRDQTPHEEGEPAARRADQGVPDPHGSDREGSSSQASDSGSTAACDPGAAEDGSSTSTGQAGGPEGPKRADDLLDDAKAFASSAASRLRRAWAAVSDDPKGAAADQSAAKDQPTKDAAAGDPSSDQPKSGPKPNKGVERVSIRAVGRRVRVLADPSVSSVTVEGPHLLRRNGTTVEVSSDGDLGPSLRDFSLIRPPKSREDLRTVGFGKQIVVRVNPSVAVDAEVTAGSLKVTDVAVLGKIRVTTGSATLEGASQVTDALVQAGTATVHGPIQQGRSLIRVESGSLHVKLSEGANVTVKGDAQWGRVSWPVEGKATMDELVIGNGAAKLDLAAVMGHITIAVDEDQA